MTEDNQHNAGEQQTPMQPQPLPGQVFVRPGIDDRPDYEKTLTEETKAALKRLAVQQNPRVPEASNERPEVQQTLINTEGGSPLTAFAHLDAAVPNLESSFLDLRDPMTAPDGTTPTKPQVHRLTAGFALGALLFTAPMAALNSVLIPQTISRLSGTDRVTDLALLSVVGTLLTFLMNAWISVGSDHSYCPLGRRTPWIIAGTVLTATSVAILSACDFMPLVIVFWLFTLIGHAMVSMPLAAAFGERVPDKFRDRADAWRGVGQAFGQVLGIIAAVSITWAADDSGWDGTTRFAMMVFALCLVVAGVATLLVLPFEGSSSYLPREGVKKGRLFFAVSSAEGRSEVLHCVCRAHVCHRSHFRHCDLPVVSCAGWFG